MKIVSVNKIKAGRRGGAACQIGYVCPNASGQDCNQTAGYSGQSAKWTTQVQVTMGGGPK